MSLEDALNRNSTALERHNELMEKTIGMAEQFRADKKGSSDDGGAKTGSKRSSSKKKDDGDEIDYAGLKSKLAKWLGEFKDNEKDGETAARKELVTKAFKAIGISKLDEIEDDQEKLKRVDTWFEEKAKTKGRLTPEPSDDDDGGSSDDDMEI